MGQIQVYVLHKSSSERLVWEYTLEQGASDYVGESQEIEVNPDLVEIIIKISISGQQPKRITVSAAEIIKNHLLTDSGFQIQSNPRSKKLAEIDR